MKYEKEIRQLLEDKIIQDKIDSEISIETSLQSMGMDSLSFVRLVIEIEDKFNIEFPEEKLLIDEAGTIKDLCEIVQSLSCK